MKTYDKQETIKYLNANSVADQELTADDVTDEVVDMFNDLLGKFIEKHPEFDLDSDDYNGEVDDKFMDEVIGKIGKKIGVGLLGEAFHVHIKPKRKKVSASKKGEEEGVVAELARIPKFKNFT